MPKRRRASSATATGSQPASAGIRVGTDFSGMEGVCFALKRLGVPVSACHHAPEHYYDDVQTRDNEQAPHVQLYTGGPPCQSFSMAGKRRAMKDPRAACLWSSLDYIVCQKPVAILMEETDNFSVIAEDALNMLLGCLQECGYVYAWTYLISTCRLSSEARSSSPCHSQHH